MRRLLFFASIWFTAVPGVAVVHPRALGHTVRGDLTRIQQGIVLAGGADMTTGAATADTFTLTVQAMATRRGRCDRWRTDRSPLWRD
jgi:hypothetical protein